MKSIIYISAPSHLSGGSFRSMMTLKILEKYNIKAYLIIPEKISIKKGRIIGRMWEPPPIGPLKYDLIRRIVKLIFIHPYHAYTLSREIKQKYGEGYFKLVYSHHENLDYVYLAILLSKLLKIQRATLLCLPAFYKRKRVMKVKLKSYDLIYPKNTFKRLAKKATYILDEKIKEGILKILLKKFHLLIAVSTSIIEEMGCEWKKRVQVLNPNTSYGHIMKGKAKIDREKHHYDAVFYARLIPEKGVLEILLIWKMVTLKLPKAKLAIAGKFSDKDVGEAFFKLIDKLSLNDNIEYLGWLPHEKLIGILRKSRIVVYPSYLDSISMVVLESLAYNKIVIAYSIPAIQHNFPIREVVKIKVGDYKAMAKAIINTLREEGYGEVNLEKFLKDFESWEKVVRGEVEILNKILSLSIQ